MAAEGYGGGKLRYDRETDFALLLKQVRNSILSDQSASYRLRGEAPIDRLAKRIIDEAVVEGASDVHIEPSGKDARLRYRIDGVLQERHGTINHDVHLILINKLKIMANLDSNEHRRPQDGHIIYAYREQEIDIRLSCMPLMSGEKAVLRILDAGAKLLSIGELGFSAANETLFRRLIHRPSGMLLTVGPVNSGKTTTLYAALNELNSPERNITSIEDPVEFALDGINQIQVNEKINFGFADGLRSVLRQDIDILMLGEIRDPVTAQMAIRSALTGHLLLTTLHAADAPSALFRLLEMDLPPYLIASSLSGIMAQRLVRRLCPHCLEAYEVPAGSDEAAFLGKHFHAGLTLYRGRGCELCRGTGYRGRMAIHEIMAFTDNLRTALLAREDIKRVRRLAAEDGLVSMAEDGIAKALSGDTSLAEIGRALYGGYET